MPSSTFQSQRLAALVLLGSSAAAAAPATRAVHPLEATEASAPAIALAEGGSLLSAVSAVPSAVWLFAGALATLGYVSLRRAGGGG